MSGEEVNVGSGVGATARRTPRQGVGASPVGSTLSIVIAVIAVVIGFLILRDLTTSDSSTAGGVDPVSSEATSTTAFDAALPTTIPVVTAPPVVLVTEGATVVVANGNTIGGSAGRMTTTLGDAGYNMGEATNARTNVDESVVYYDPNNAAAQAVAESVARSLGGVTVEPVGTPPPTGSGTLDGAGVIVVLGNNQADKTLETLAAESGAAAAPLGTAPPVAGGDVVAPVAPAADAGDAGE